MRFRTRRRASGKSCAAKRRERPGHGDHDQPMNEALSQANEPFRFASKATTPERLAPRVTRARTCDQVTLPVDAWHRGRESLVAEILRRFASARLSVRSSAATARQCPGNADIPEKGRHGHVREAVSGKKHHRSKYTRFPRRLLPQRQSCPRRGARPAVGTIRVSRMTSPPLGPGTAPMDANPVT